MCVLSIKTVVEDEFKASPRSPILLIKTLILVLLLLEFIAATGEELFVISTKNWDPGLVMRMVWLMVSAVGIIVFVIGLLSPTAYGEEPDSNSNWNFNLAPMYLWAVSITGDITVKGFEVDMDVPFSDIFDGLDGALTFHFEGLYKQRWEFFPDLNYIKLSPYDDGEIEIDYTQVQAELGGLYRLTRDAYAFDGLAGLRLRGDIGGFGIGSDLTWNLVGLINFKPWKHVALVGGYRALYQDFSQGNGKNKSEFDATMHGPVLGLNIPW